MATRHRIGALLLLGSAVGAWVAVGWLLVNRSPVGQPLVQLVGAIAIGAAAGLTAWPLLWLGGLMRPGRAETTGDPGRAGRRALVIALAVMVLVILRSQATLSLPLALFVVTLAVLVEAAFTLRR